MQKEIVEKMINAIELLAVNVDIEKVDQDFIINMLDELRRELNNE